MRNGRNWIKTNQGIGFIFTLALIALLICLELSPWVYEEVRDGFTLGFFPVLIVIVLLIFSLFLILDKHRKEIPKDLQTFAFKPFLFGILILITTQFYFGLMRKLGFLIVTPCYLVIFIYILGIKSWRFCITSALLMTTIVYGVFYSIGFKLPSGILTHILPF